jgi:hypothetical protein
MFSLTSGTQNSKNDRNFKNDRIVQWRLFWGGLNERGEYKTREQRRGVNIVEIFHIHL